MPRSKSARNCTILPWLTEKWDGKEGRFIQVGNSLLLSKKFQALGQGRQLLYLCMALESGGKQEFKFTHGTAKKYGFAASTYDKYLSELCAAGFVEKIEYPGMAQYAPVTLKFSNRWKSDTHTVGG